jgi:hypothetical protein
LDLGIREFMDETDSHAIHPGDAQETDPQSGVSDDPRVDSTPDLRQSDTTTNTDTET